MEEIVSGMIRFFPKVVGWILFELLFDIVCWGLGWVTLKLITVGKYPNKNTSESTVSIAGVVVLLLLLAVLTRVIV